MKALKPNKDTSCIVKIGSKVFPPASFAKKITTFFRLSYFKWKLIFPLNLILLFTICYTPNALSQTPRPGQQGYFCGTPFSIDTPESPEDDGNILLPPCAIQNECWGFGNNSCADNSPAGCAYRIPLAIHIVRETDGTGGVTNATLDADIAALNALYADMNMEYYECCPRDFIDNDDLYDYESYNNDRDGLLDESYKPNAINMYVVDDGAQSGTAANPFDICGVAPLPGGNVDWFVMNRTCMGNAETTAHELGHYFGLLHPHTDPSGQTPRTTQENPNNDNASIAYCDCFAADTGTGDGIGDTPPDPILSEDCPGADCIVASGGCAPQWGAGMGPSTGAFTVDDCDGTTSTANLGDYSPDLDNVMSYAPYTSCNADQFTACQRAKVIDVLTNCRSYLCCRDVDAEFAEGLEDTEMQICPGDPAPTFTATSDCYSWYDGIGAAANSLAANSTTFTPTLGTGVGELDNNTPGTYTWYLDDANDYNPDCRTPITVTVLAEPGTGSGNGTTAVVVTECNAASTITLDTDITALDGNCVIGWWITETNPASTGINNDALLNTAISGATIGGSISNPVDNIIESTGGTPVNDLSLSFDCSTLDENLTYYATPLVAKSALEIPDAQCVVDAGATSNITFNGEPGKFNIINPNDICRPDPVCFPPTFTYCITVAGYTGTPGDLSIVIRDDNTNGNTLVSDFFVGTGTGNATYCYDETDMPGYDPSDPSVVTGLTGLVWEQLGDGMQNATLTTTLDITYPGKPAVPFPTTTGYADCLFGSPVELTCDCTVCPTVTAVTDDDGTVCTGDGADDFATWQTAVAIANTTGVVYSSVTPVAGTTAPDNILPTGNHSASPGCAAETQIVMAYVYCDVDASGTDNAGDTYSLVSTYRLTVYPLPDVTNAAGGVCSDMVMDNCGAGVTILYDDGAGGPISNPTPPTLNPGDTNIIVNWSATVTGAPTACVTSGGFVLTCPANCPVVTEVSNSTSLCSGALTDEITNWQTTLETTNAAAIADANTDAAVSYDALPTNSNPTGCTDLAETRTATLNCFGPDGIDDGGANDDVLLTLGVFSLTTFPAAQSPTDNIAGCMNTPAIACVGDIFGTVGSNPTGGASAANWNGTMYTAQPGDAAGTIDIEVRTTNGCIEVFSIATPACPSECPAVTNELGNASICPGALTDEITNWQTTLETTNAAAIADANTSAAPTYSDPPTNLNSTCSNVVETMTATLNCFGPDGIDDSGANDDVSLALGTFTLTTFPAAQNPTDNIVGCMNTPTRVCVGDTFGTLSNPTGGASAANWNGTMYTAQPGDAAGTIDIEVITANNCTEVFTIATPACPSECPVITNESDNASICSGALTNEITNWQTTLEAANAAAIADANTDAAVSYDALPTNSNPIGCVDLAETTTATLNCFGPDGIDDGGANDDVLLTLGVFSLTTFPEAQRPTDNLVGCMNTPIVFCTGDTFGAASNPTGGASAGNWNGTMYIAQPGDAAGTIDIEVTTTNGCTEIFTITTPACDACEDVQAGVLDICDILANNPTSSLGTLDCDGGGVDNATECANGGDPADSTDECTSAIGAGLDICDIIANNPLSTLATLDCDGGGVDNATECANGGDPANGADECIAAIGAGLDICDIIENNPSSSLATLDCDSGGVNNTIECANGGDPTDSIDECTIAIAAGIDICEVLAANPTSPLGALDCDGGGVDNATECANGGDPADGTDECTSAIGAGLDICDIIANNPLSTLATLDCDSGGLDNATECASGGNPADSADDICDLGLVCPQDSTDISCTATGFTALELFVLINGVIDPNTACENPTMTSDYIAPTDPCGGNVTTTFTVRIDGLIDTTCASVITVNPIAPTITCNSSETTPIAISCLSEIASSPPDASSLCGAAIASVEPGDIVPDVGNNACDETNGNRYTVIFTATDECGGTAQCIEYYIIENAISETPAIVAFPADVTGLTCGDMIPAADIALVSAVDSCTLAGAVITHEGDSPDPATFSFCAADGPFVVTRTYRATDACGLFIDSIQTFTFDTDTIAPSIICPISPTVILTCNDTLPAPDTTLVIVTDNCTSDADIVITYMGDDPDPANFDYCSGDASLYTVTRTYRAVDLCGNESTCEQTFNFGADIEPPVLTCPDDITGLACGEELPAAETSLPGVDNCDPATTFDVTHVDVSNNADGCSATPLVITRTYTGSDACGNVAATCDQVFTYAAGDTPPEIVCPEDCPVACASDIRPGTPTYTTSCGIDATLSVSDVVIVGDPGCDGTTYTYTHTVTDACGRIATCDQVFTIVNECHLVDFDFDDAGNPLAPSLEVSDQYEDFTVTTDNPHRCVQLFDTENPTSNDFDLGTPNEQYGGPGIGAGGDNNTEFQGNALIVSKDCGVPNETEGQLIFTFDCSVTIKTVDLLDMKCGHSEIELYDEHHNLIEELPIPGYGVNSFNTFDVHVSGVYTMIIDLDCGGGVTAFKYCKDNTPGADCEAPESICEDYNLDFDNSGYHWTTNGTSDSFDVGDQSYTITIIDDDGILEDTYENDGGLLIGIDPHDVDDEVVICYNLSQVTDNVSFDIFDLDYKDYQNGSRQHEAVCVYGLLGNDLTQILPTITSLDGHVDVDSNCAEGTTDSAQSHDDESVLVEFNECIDKVVIVYGTGSDSPVADPSYSKITIGESIGFNSEVCPGDCSSECTDATGGAGVDSDGDGVCDDEDECPGGNDNIDSDGDGTPDDCEDICYDYNIDHGDCGAGWQHGDESGTVELGPENISIDILDDDDILENTNADGAGLNIGIDPQTVDDELVLCYTLSQSSSNVVFDIVDLDFKDPKQQEAVCIFGTLGSDPTPILPIITSLDGSVTIDGNCAEGAANSALSHQDESILIEFTECIDKITIVYGTGSNPSVVDNPDYSGIIIGESTFSVEQCKGGCDEPCPPTTSGGDGDTDNDGVCNDQDICEGGDDFMDTDGDGTPDFCDDDCTSGTNAPGDEDGDFVCDDVDECPGFDDNIDENNNGTPDGCEVECEDYTLNFAEPGYDWSGHNMMESYTVGSQTFDVQIIDGDGILTSSHDRESGLAIGTNPHDVHDEVVICYNLSEVASNVRFDIFDLDLKTGHQAQQEAVCVYGTLGADPTQVMPTITPLDGSVVINGNCAEAGANSSISGQDESILVEFTECIDKVTIVYGTGSSSPASNPDHGKITIGHDLGFVTEVCSNTCPDSRIEDEENAHISLYPNPVYGNGNVTIEIDTEARGDAQVVLIDALGRTVSNENIQLVNDLTIHQFSTDPLAAGVYFVQLQTQEWRTDGMKLVVVKP